MVYDQKRLIEKSTVIDIVTKKRLTELPINFLFDYNIFPDYIMTALCQWKSEKRNMCVGDTIVQQAFLPPTRYFSHKILMGVRINNIINESKRLGFSYETLEGHIEQGVSTFMIEELEEGKIIFKIHTFSKPQHILAKLVSRIFSVPYQVFCTNQALKNAKKQLEKYN
ncbi:hypothetical protein DDR33_24535 [Pararcticibacter amylolyticus]|uniref:DUF1990 domain-containing protein n=1 Tax=Pararcticibacter amylolyticus TaxID=2173175 RepID=A0A2U2P9I9_9SPHI|nr:hypothetical protein DDR33_24535 [Pararcticibacter amylolyticus]